ncbi:hypothetical protein [Sphingomonas soli]|uniref:hypothetical protein n=1 Tax=Sphingomonas soli TaxID=266127 RepID=UPI00083199E9|nr:hypothetical protein [Sphingomonas soli]
MKTLPLVSLTVMLALGACNGTPQTTDNASVNVADAVALDNFSDDDDDEVAVVEDVAGAPAVVVPAVPKPAASAPAAEKAPLTDAAKIEEEIRGGRNIKRIRHGDGWAWMRDGRILRTADDDGDNVAYFRGGETRPFFVQREGRSFAYQGDKPVREFDRDGRGRTPDADRTREANEAAREAREQRERAERARESATRPDRDRNTPGRDRPGRDRPEATPTPTPSPSATATPRGPTRDRDRVRTDRPAEWQGKDRPRPEPQ